MKITVRSGPTTGVFSLVAGAMLMVNGNLQRNDHALSTTLYVVGGVCVLLGILVVALRSPFVVIDGDTVRRYGALGLFHRTTVLADGDSLYHADNKLYLRRAHGGPKKLADKWMATADDWSAMTRALDERG